MGGCFKEKLTVIETLYRNSSRYLRRPDPNPVELVLCSGNATTDAAIKRHLGFFSIDLHAPEDGNICVLWASCIFSIDINFKTTFSQHCVGSAPFYSGTPISVDSVFTRHVIVSLEPDWSRHQKSMTGYHGTISFPIMEKDQSQ